MNRAAVLAALASAALFGVSTPAAKALLGVVHPVVLAGLFYCGAGIGIALLRALAGPILNAPAARQPPLARQDYGWLAGAIALGGVVGPVLLMLGLARTPAATASLLLTMEGAATALLAWFVFHENFDRRIALGMACLVAGAATVSWSGTPTIESVAGPLAIIGACIAWGIASRPARHARGRARRLRLLRREPRAVRVRAASSRHGAHRRLFFDRAVHRRGDRGHRLAAAADGPARCRRSADGGRGLAVRHRAPRARAYPSPHGARPFAPARRASPTHARPAGSAGRAPHPCARARRADPLTPARARHASRSPALSAARPL